MPTDVQVADERGPDGLHFYRSNRVEALADAAADLFATPASGATPFDLEHVVVQGRGMAVWLSMQLSHRHGIWAGAKFLYPRNFVQSLFEDVVGRGVSQRYERQELMWSVLASLSGLSSSAADDPLATLASYVQRDDAGVRQFQLARRIADTFDQYVTYRPDWIRGWEAGRDTVGDSGLGEDAWQPILWRMLSEQLGTHHAAALERELLTRLTSDDEIPGLPARIAVFGIASLPPMYARVLAALAKRVEIHWFLPSPASGYWADLATPERVARAGEDAPKLHLDSGHPLLASLGRLGAELQVVVSEQLEALGVEDREPRGDLHQAPEPTTVLARVQHDILVAELGTYARVPEGDTSVSFHACHSPMREVEVLHDQLLSLITEEGVLPHEVVVMTPDVEAYAPLIEAVFDREPGDARFIPYRIADRHLRRDSAVVDAFFRILELAGGRAPVSSVLDLLGLAPVQARFGIRSEQIDQLRRWIADSGVRWGIDEQHRAEHGQPEERANTWRFGVERMMLGYAMPSDDRTLFEGTLGYDEIEGQDALLLGRLAAFCDALFAAMRRMETAQTVGVFAQTLSDALDALLDADTDNAFEHRVLRRALGDMATSAQAAGFEEEVGIEVVRAWLEERVELAEPARGFLAGGITFCAMVPMRNIPFRVVCLLGLSDQSFPRTRRPVDFDLMARRAPPTPDASDEASRAFRRRPGDRSRRDDDRYLFLEALLAARDRVLLVYTGQSVRDGSELAPSVVVSELQDAIVASHPDDVEGVAALSVQHPLQPFNQRYFDGSDGALFSYSGEFCVAAERLARGGQQPPEPLFSEPLATTEEARRDQQRTVALGELIRFFEAPVRYLMTRRLGVDLRDHGLELSDREPIDLDHLERWSVGQQLLTLRVDGVGVEESEALARAMGVLPLGTPGTLEHRAILQIVEPIAERVHTLREGGELPPLALSRRLDNGTLVTGEIGGRYPRGLLRHQYARVSGKHLIAQWIRHLAMCWQEESALVRESFVVGRAPVSDKRETIAYRMPFVERPEPLLRKLAELYFHGLNQPLRWFPKAAFAYATALAKGNEDVRALGRAQGVYEREVWARDPHVARVFGTEDVIFDARPDGFAAVSRQVMLPLVSALEELP